MTVRVPWIPEEAPPAPGAPPPAPAQGSANLGTLLVLGIVGAGIVQWVAGRQRAREEEENAKALAAQADEAHFALEGAREDEQLRLADAFSRRPMGGVGWGP